MSIEPASVEFDQWGTLLELILDAFSYMAPLINPPSSALRLTPEGLAEKAQQEKLFLAWDKDELVGCAFFRVEPDTLYIGKVAIAAAYQRRGLGRQFFCKAEEVARSLGLKQLQLETRVELKGNHRAFGQLGFVKTGENAHAGFSRPTSITMTKIL